MAGKEIKSTSEVIKQTPWKILLSREKSSLVPIRFSHFCLMFINNMFSTSYKKNSFILKMIRYKLWMCYVAESNFNPFLIVYDYISFKNSLYLVFYFAAAVKSLVIKLISSY